MSYQRPTRPADLEAQISFLGTQEGGRRRPVKSGYRPNHDFGLPGELNDAQHEYPQEWVLPGTTTPALLWLLLPERQAGRLLPGFRFTVQEGGRVVGHGEITRVLNRALEGKGLAAEAQRAISTFPTAARDAHRHSSGHRAELLTSGVCGCFYCCATYPPNAINDWVDEDASGEGQTAICPRCGIDSVIGDRSGFEITKAFLEMMRSYWF